MGVCVEERNWLPPNLFLWEKNKKNKLTNSKDILQPHHTSPPALDKSYSRPRAPTRSTQTRQSRYPPVCAPPARKHKDHAAAQISTRVPLPRTPGSPRWRQCCRRRRWWGCRRRWNSRRLGRRRTGSGIATTGTFALVTFHFAFAKELERKPKEGGTTTDAEIRHRGGAGGSNVVVDLGREDELATDRGQKKKKKKKKTERPKRKKTTKKKKKKKKTKK